VSATLNLPRWEGWHLIGAYPDHEPDDVGSWLLHHDGEAVLLEVPEGLPVADVRQALHDVGVNLTRVTASHDHEDHLDADAWDALAKGFPDARFIHPSAVKGDRLLHVGGEPLWLVKAPKHSATDLVAVFRGVAMTGDIELGMLESVNDEVPERTKRRSMKWLAEFQARTGYYVHSIVSAHLNDVRLEINWPDLFAV
jgi:hydroxyacylglutathione hydrolase